MSRTSIHRVIPTNEFLAILNSNSATALNPFATIADVVAAAFTIPVVTNYAALPLPATAIGKYSNVVNSQGTAWLPGSLGGTYYPKGIYYCDGLTWEYVGEFPYQATQSEVDAGIDNDKFVTPATFNAAAKWNTKANVSGQVFTGAISATNLSGTNTGDNAANTTSDAYADSLVVNTITGGDLTHAPSSDAFLTYLSALALGLVWHEPVELINVIGNSNTPIAGVHLDGYIIDTGGNTGAWSAFSPGDLIQYQTNAWVLIKSLVIGDNLGVAFKTSTTPIGLFAGKNDYLVEVTGGTPGAFTYTFAAPNNNDAIFIQNINAYYHSVAFTYSTELLQWVQFSGSINLQFDSNFTQVGNNVGIDPTVLRTTISFSANVLATLLTGLSVATAQVIASTDTVLSALGYLQAQITALVPSPKIKSGVVAAGSFAGNPKKATVTFGTAFADANYSVSIVGVDSRAWSIETVAAGSFVINARANANLTGNVHWTATKNGEN